jgi:quinol monooxygenase YgiN
MSGTSDAVVFVVVINPLAGEQQAVREALDRSIPQVHQEAGCHTYALHECDDRFVLIERWASAEAAGAHAAGPAVKAYLEEVAGRVERSDLLAITPIPIGDAQKGVLQ